MFKSILVIFILFVSVFAATPTIFIDSNNTKLENFPLEYFTDSSQKLTLEKIKKQNFHASTSRSSYGLLQNITWLRFTLKNSTSTDKKLFIHNRHAYIANGIDFYVLKDDKLIASQKILMEHNKKTNKQMYSTDAIMKVSLQPYEEKTIYIKSFMRVMQFPYFTIYSEKNSKKKMSQSNTFLLLILGMLIALAFYHGTLYLTTNNKEYLYYTLYLISGVIWESFMSGLQATNLGIYPSPKTDILLIIVDFIPLFTALFAKTLFETKEKYTKENFYLNTLIFLSILIIVIGVFDVVIGLVATSGLFIYMFITIFFVTYSIHSKGNRLAMVFLIANGIFSLFMLFTDFYYIGILEYSPFVFNGASIGMVIESIILSFVLTYKIRLLQHKELEQSKELIYSKEIKKINKALQFRIDEEVALSQKKDKILFQQNKLASMGEMIQNIAHQWRQPLAQINSSVLLIDTYLEEKNLNKNALDKELQSIEDLTIYMSKTIDSFQNFLQPNKVSTSFFLKELIHSSLLILKSALSSNDIKIIVSINEKFKYFGLEDELKQVILILLNNAKDAIIKDQTIDPYIKISAKKLPSSYLISVNDNAGGINNKIIDKIFDPYFSTKYKSQGTGLGLYISKIIIEDNMLGRLSVQNSEYGACFEIELPIH